VFVIRHLLTTTFAGKLKPAAAPDEFRLRIYVGGAKNEGPARDKAIKVVEKFLPASGYAYYNIVASKYLWLWTAYEFTIRFRRA
jgi:hypothetical protein